MQVRDIMTEAAVTESKQDSLRLAAERMWRQQTGSLLVTEDGQLTGIITERDLLRAVALGADPDKTSVDDAMTTEVYTVPPDMQLQDAARVMADTALSKASSVRGDGAVTPLILRTNCRAAASISSGVAGGSKPRKVVMFRHMGRGLVIVSRPSR